MAEPKGAHGGGGQQQCLRELNRLPDPPGRQHSEKVPMGENKHAPALPLQPSRDTVSPVGNLLDRLAAGAAVAKQLPPRTDGPNFF